MPVVLSGPGVNVAPAGRTAAVSVVIASPSGSTAVTSTVSSSFSAMLAVAGALTTGGRSTFVTVTTVVAEPESALAAVNVMVWLLVQGGGAGYWVSLLRHGLRPGQPDVNARVRSTCGR